MVLEWPDIIIASIIIISVLVSLVRGLVKEVISLASWVMAAWVATMGAKPVSQYITFTSIDTMKLFIAFLALFVSMVFVGAIVNFIIGKFVRKTPFSMPDRFMGGAFGLLRGGMVVVVLILLGGLTPFPKEQWWQESYGITSFENVALWLHKQLPQDMAENFDFSHQEIIEKTVKNFNSLEVSTITESTD